MNESKDTRLTSPLRAVVLLLVPVVMICCNFWYHYQKYSTEIEQYEDAKLGGLVEKPGSEIRKPDSERHPREDINEEKK